MKIFIPSYKDPNPFFDEIIPFSVNDYIFDDFRNFKSDYALVNIHWPEALFNWQEPTQEDLQRLKKEIKKWKENAIVIYTRHDEKRHLGMTPRFEELFQIVERNTDAFIHMGEFSKKQMVSKFPKVKHAVIPHPLYEKSYRKMDKSVARKALNIKQDSLVMIAPGRIRNQKEKDLVLKTFKSIAIKEKVLLSNYMLPFEFHVNFPGRVRLKKIFDVNKYFTLRKEKKFHPPKFLFHYSFVDSNQLSLMLAAADFVFIPRLNILNSGNVLLGLSFEKVVVGPAIGNVEEQLLEIGFPVFDPKSFSSVKRAIKKGIDLAGKTESSYFKGINKKYSPAQVSKQMDLFFESFF